MMLISPTTKRMRASKFGRSQVELEQAKSKISSVKDQVQTGYTERNRIRKEMQDLADRLQEINLEARMEWQLQDRAIAEADRVIRDPTPTAQVADATGHDDKEKEDTDQHEILEAIHRNQTAIDALSAKKQMFADALEEIKDGTGYELMDELAEQFEAYEDEVSRNASVEIM